MKLASFHSWADQQLSLVVALPDVAFEGAFRFVYASDRLRIAAHVWSQELR